MDNKEYYNLCRLVADNYLNLEKEFFWIAGIIYVYDDWPKKKEISTMPLANLLIKICSGVEEASKFLLVNPENDLTNEFLSHVENLPKEYNVGRKAKQELKEKKLEKIKLNWILEFKNFRIKLNEFSEHVVFIREPLILNFKENFLEYEKEKPEGKPKWYCIYDSLKHNFYTKYTKATIEDVLNALAAFYLITKILINEAHPISGSHFPWYKAFVRNGPSRIQSQKNHIHTLDSEFENINLYEQPTN